MERRDIRSPRVCQPGSIYAQDNAPTHIYQGQEVPRAPHRAGWLTREWSEYLVSKIGALAIAKSLNKI